MPAHFDPHKHQRRSIRGKGYDYTRAGAYFVTICTWQRECLFGEVVDGEMILSPIGSIAAECWRVIPVHFPTAELGAFVVMPNHVHGILILNDEGRSTIHGRGTIYRAPTNVWQRNYYKHIIRDDAEWRKIHDYILTNPRRWDEERKNPIYMGLPLTR